MTLQEELLRQTLAKVRHGIEPSPGMLDGVRVAVARAERQRRLVAAAVSVAVVLVTLLVLFAVVSIRAG